MNYAEYLNFRYFVTREDHFYVQILHPTKEQKEKAKYYRHLSNILEAFEIDAIKEALRKTKKSKQDFIKECEEDFK